MVHFFLHFCNCITTKKVRFGGTFYISVNFISTKKVRFGGTFYISAIYLGMRGKFKIICGFGCILVIFPDTFNNAFKALESGILTSWTRKCGPLGIWGGGGCVRTLRTPPAYGPELY